MRFLGPLAFLALSSVCVAQAGPAQGMPADELRRLLVSFKVPGRSAPEWFRAPSPAARLEFAAAVDAAWRGDAAASRARAANAGYQLLEVNRSGPGGRVLILREVRRPGEEGYRAQGLYAFRPAARYRLVIQAPHPRNDLQTRVEAIDAFLGTNAAALFIAGIHRDNASTLSPCTPGTYRISDAAHWDAHFFHAAHVAVAQAEPTAIAVQLHGYANPGEEHFILSEGVAAAPPAGSFVRLLETELEKGEGYIAHVFPVETGRLGATWNTQGRYSNGVLANPCSVAAASAGGTFVHVEQIRAVRREPAKFLRALRRVAEQLWP